MKKIATDGKEWIDGDDATICGIRWRTTALKYIEFLLPQARYALYKITNESDNNNGIVQLTNVLYTV